MNDKYNRLIAIGSRVSYYSDPQNKWIYGEVVGLPVGAGLPIDTDYATVQFDNVFPAINVSWEHLIACDSDVDKEYNVPLEFVIIARSRKEAYEKAKYFHEKICSDGSYPCDSVQSGVSLAGVKTDCYICVGLGQGPNRGVPCPACGGTGKQ